MTKQVFGWFPDVDSTMGIKPSVSQTKFGDGYEARVAIGINSLPQKWKLTFTRDRITGLAILSFLETMGGVENFTWINPHNRSGTYVCREWSSQQQQGMLQVTCDFEQVFEY